MGEEQIVAKLDSHLETGDGQKVMDYSKRICNELGVQVEVLWPLTYIESRFNPFAANPTSSARGLTQFLSSTWSGFMKHCQKNNIHHPEWGPAPLTQESRNNPYASIYAGAWLMKKTKDSLGFNNNLSIEEQGKLYYLAHHEGAAGAKAYLRFLERMNKEGFTEPQQIAQLYHSDREKFDNLTKGVFVGSQSDRIQSKGIEKFLSVYYKLSSSVGAMAAASIETDRAVASKGPIDRELDVGLDHKAIIDLKDNQDRWIIGSSTAVGLKGHREGNSGIIGIVASNASDFYSKLREVIWPQVQHIKHPKEVVLVGLAVNGLSTDSDRQMRKTIKGYMKIAKFFESKGVKVRIATVQPAKNRGEQIHKFNEIIRQEYPQYCLDLAKSIETLDGKHIKTEYASSDGKHVNKRGKKLFASMIEGGDYA